MKKSKIPPIGVRPYHIFEAEMMEERINELKEAIKRFVDSNYPIPIKIIKEYNDLTAGLPKEEKDEFDELKDYFIKFKNKEVVNI